MSSDDIDASDSDSEYNSELDFVVHMRMEDDVDALEGVDIDSDVDMDREGQDAEDQEDDDVMEDEEVEDDQEEDDHEDEDNGKEP
jgi:hypothetical protein